MARRLITKEDLATFKPVSTGVSSAKIELFIDEAQFNDLRPLMCDAFYAALMADDGTTYGDVMNGSLYEITPGVQVEHFGIKAALSYFTWARYVMRGDVQDNPFSMGQKKNEWSEPLTDTAKRNMRDEARIVANNHWAEVRKFLDAKVATYPIWKECHQCGCRGNGSSANTNQSFNHSTF